MSEIHSAGPYRESAPALCSGWPGMDGDDSGRRDGSRTTFLSPVASCRWASLTMSFSRYPNRAACSSRTERTSATTGSESIVDLQQFLWRADHRRLISHSTTDRFDPRPEGWVRDMPAIPGQEILDAVCGGNGDMESVCGSLRGQRTIIKQSCSEGLSPVRHFQKGDIRQNLKTSSRSCSIPGSTLGYNEPRDVNGKAMSVVSPPFTGGLLVSGDTENSARLHGEVADNRRFKVHARRHISPCIPSVRTIISSSTAAMSPPSGKRPSSRKSGIAISWESFVDKRVRVYITYAPKRSRPPRGPRLQSAPRFPTP